MTQLLTAASQLLTYLQRYTPEFAQGFNSGISRTAIQDTLELLDYQLPEDFYELYEWSNGHSDYFQQPLESAQICQFSPIELVAEDKRWDWFGNTPPNYKEHPVLPFVQDDSRFFGIALGRSYQSEAHIVYVSREGDTTLRYDSITSMLESTVECFSSGAFHLGENGLLEESCPLSSEILRAKNPKTLTEAMKVIIALLSRYGSDEETSEDSYGILVSSLFSALETVKFLRPPEVVTLVRDRLSTLENTSSDRTRSAHYSLNRWLAEVENQ